MSDLKIQGEVSLDTANADEALVKVEKGASRMAEAVGNAGKKAGTGLSEIGNGGDVSAAKVDKSTKSIVASIQRATALMEAGSKTSTKYYEALANQRGVSVDALRPYLDQLEKVNQSQVKVGISANQTAAAMRNVPAQFTDIITSLQGGQAPLTVFLQQGGQLKDMFGGAGNAAKALGGYVFGLINPVTIATAAVGGLAYVYAQSNNEAKEFSKALITSNNAAGLSVDVLRNLSTNIEAVGASSRSVANDSLLSLVGAGNVASSMIEKAALASVNAQTIMGKAVADTAKEFAELGKSPTSAVEKLNEKYHFLTMEIYDQIKAYEDQGRAADAAKLAQSSYADALLSQSGKVKETLTDWERGWLRIKTATSGAFNSVMTMFDDPTNDQKIAKLFKERDKLEESQKNLAGDNSFLNRGQAQRVQALLDQNKAEINAIREKIKAKNDEAKAEEEKNKQVIAGIEWSKLYSQSLDKQEKKAKEIAAAENARSQALFGKNKAEIELDKEKLKLLESDAQLRKVKSSIDEKYAQKAKTQIVEQSIAWKAHEVNVAAAGKAETKVLSDIEKSIAAIKFPNALKQITDEFEKQTATFNKINAGLDEYALGLQGQNELAQLELSLIGQSATERGILVEQYKIELALQKEIRKIKSEIKDADAAQILIDKATSNANVEKSQVALKVQQQEWTKFYGDIYNGLTDSLYRGFEAGKGFFQSFWDGIKNLFKTTVLKLAVQGVVTGILGMGTVGQANAMKAMGQSGADPISMISAGKSMYEGFASGFSGFGDSVANYVQAGLDKAGLSMTGGGNSAFASGAGTAASYAGGAAVGIYGGRAISGGYSVTGGNAAVNIGTAIGAIWGPIGMAIGGAIGGLVNRAFGRKADKLQQSELSGSFGGNGFSGSVRDVYKAEGGWFSGDKWSEKVNPVGDTKSLTDAFMSIKSAAYGYASILGLSAESLNNFSKEFKVNLSITGDAAKDAAANEKIMTDLIMGLSNDISTFLAPELSKFAKEGEQAAATMARLSNSLLTVNGIMSSVGIAEFAKSLEGASAAERLAELTGGIEKLATGAQYFFENFLTDAEKIKPSADLVTDTLKRLGQSSVDTIDEFKNLVQGLDLATESGAKMYAELIAIAPQFKAVADFAKQSAEEIKKAEEEKTKVIQQGNADRAAILADRRAADLAQQTIKKAADEAFKTLTESVTSGMQSMLRAGNVGAALAAQMSITSFNSAQYTDANGFNAGAFNRTYAFAKANAAKGLMSSVSADALNVQDVSKVMQDLIATVFDDAIVASNKSNLIDQLKLPANDLIKTAMNGLLDAGIQQYMNENSIGRGAGIASVLGAQMDYLFASFEGMGLDLVEYTKFVDGLTWSLDKGNISQGDYAQALEAANKVIGSSIELIGNEAAQRERIAASQKALNDAGLNSVSFYFNQISKSVEALNEAASLANTPLAQVTAGIGRLTSLSDVFSQSAKAALSGGANLGNGQLINAQIVAEAAAKAASVITTADAAQAAKLLAEKESFAGVGGSQLRDVSMILDGVKAFDAAAFESSFMRMNDALNKGTITQEQYQDIFQQSLNTFSGVDDVTKQLTDSMTKLRDSMGSFADQILIDKSKTTLGAGATLEEIARQYDIARIGAMTGNPDSIGQFQNLANQILDINKYKSRADYNTAFGSVYADARNLENIGVRALSQNSGESVVNELRSMNANLAKKVENLESSLMAALAQIAQNTKDTANNIEASNIT